MSQIIDLKSILKITLLAISFYAARDLYSAYHNSTPSQYTPNIKTSSSSLIIKGQAQSKKQTLFKLIIDSQELKKTFINVTKTDKAKLESVSYFEIQKVKVIPSDNCLIDTQLFQRKQQLGKQSELMKKKLGIVGQIIDYVYQFIQYILGSNQRKLKFNQSSLEISNKSFLYVYGTLICDIKTKKIKIVTPKIISSTLKKIQDNLYQQFRYKCWIYLGIIAVGFLVYWLYSQLCENSEKIQREERNNVKGAVGLQCVVCWQRQRNIVFQGCGHLCVCSLCQQYIQKKCPICNKMYFNCLRVYIA